MKLKQVFLLHTVEKDHLAITEDDGPNGFHGIIRMNETGEAVFSCLMEDTTPEKVVEQLLEEYDADRSVIEENVYGMIHKLEQAGLLDGAVGLKTGGA